MNHPRLLSSVDWKSHARRWWLLGLVAVALPLLNVLLFVYGDRYGDFERYLASGAFVGQIGIFALIGGLGSRSWTRGLAVACTLTTSIIAAMLRYEAEKNQYLTDDYWSICFVPMAAMIISIPFMVLRLWGWHLSRPTNSDLSYARLGMENILVLITIIASMAALFRTPIALWGESSVPYEVGIFAGALMVASGLIFLPAFLIAFRETKHIWMVSLSGCFTAAIVGLSQFVLGKLGVGAVSGDSAIVLAISFGLCTTVTFLLGCNILFMSGFRFRKNTRSAESVLERAAPQSFRLEHRMTSVLFVILAMGVSIASGRILAQREQRSTEILQLRDDVEKAHGQVRFLGKEIDQLRLPREATDEMMLGLTPLTSLECLCVADTKLTDRSIEGLSRFPELRWLDLSNTQLTDDGFLGLRNCHRLRHLSIAGTKVSATALSKIDQITPGLKSLDIGDLGLSDDDLLSMKLGVSHFFPLSFLSLRNNRLSDEGVRTFLEKHSAKRHYIDWIYRLDLSGNSISGSCFDGGLWVSELHLNRVPLTDANFGPVLSGMQVDYLVLSHTELTDSFLGDLAAAVTVLGFELGDGNFTSEGLGPLGSRQWTRVRLTGSQFSGRCFQAWSPATPYLMLSGPHFDDQTVDDLVDNRSIKYLELEKTSISDRSLGVIATLRSLEQLELRGTGVTAEGLIQSRIPGTVVLRLSPNQFTPEKIKLLRSKFERVIVDELDLSDLSRTADKLSRSHSVDWSE